MRHSLIAPIIALSLALSGCSTLGAITAPTGSVAAVSPGTVLAAKKVLIAAHGLHEAAADTLTALAKSGACIRTCASTAKVYLDKSADYLKAADRLATLGDAQGAQARIAEATKLLIQIQSIAGGK